jgi:hypothetical protein
MHHWRARKRSQQLLALSMETCPGAFAASPFHIALAAIDSRPNAVLAPVGRRHPKPLDPRRAVPDMLGMTALEVGHPVSLFVLV